MRVMPANNTGAFRLEAKHPGRLGMLFSPGGQFDPRHLPYALDNGAYRAYRRGERWSSMAFLRLLAWAKQLPTAPLWVAVPDVVGDAGATLREWEIWRPALAAFGWPLAFVAQDGMTPDDVPAEAAIVFLGGTTRWKWANVHRWAEACRRLHVGRVNGRRLYQCDALGVESIDGTGWFRGDRRQLAILERYLAGIPQYPGQRTLC